MMTEQEFDKMWQRAEVAPHARRLAEGYRPWLVRRRRTEGALAAVAVIALAAVPILTRQQPMTTDGSYTAAYCNRADVDNQYCVDMADALLMEA